MVSGMFCLMQATKSIWSTEKCTNPMSFFGNVNKYNKATTVVRFFNASCSRYIDLLRNSCYCTSQVPIPPTLLKCLPHPWNIPQSTHLRNISSTIKTFETKHLSIKTCWEAFHVTQQKCHHPDNFKQMFLQDLSIQLFTFLTKIFDRLHQLLGGERELGAMGALCACIAARFF